MTNSDPESCPVIKKAFRVIELSNDLKSSVRSLRVSMRRCNGCENPCTLIKTLHDQITLAITQLTKEWSLDELLR